MSNECCPNCGRPRQLKEDFDDANEGDRRQQQNDEPIPTYEPDGPFWKSPGI